MPELTNTILTKANLLMNKYGISSVTMDDIAKECRISKRTLYEKIPDKKTLVWHCFLFNKDIHQAEARELVTKSTSILEALLHIYRNIRETITESSSVFFKDLHRLYPDMEKQCRSIHREQANTFGQFLSKGIEQGMFRNDLNMDLAAEVFTAQSSAIMKELGTTKDIETVKSMIDTAFVIFLRGVATPKGLSLIDKFLDENNIK